MKEKQAIICYGSQEVGKVLTCVGNQNYHLIRLEQDCSIPKFVVIVNDKDASSKIKNATTKEVADNYSVIMARSYIAECNLPRIRVGLILAVAILAALFVALLVNFTA